ncbi:unnamed protein product [Brassicogethes aeneus]|uniref:C2H2-type domain-containing protein n=1 Tax=Brassicogethes aeneus TaxID=1431903 RepID=A0A9P0ATF2_BRAAE|nr:unnamed protein product [Brassicogethes aeneus]
MFFCKDKFRTEITHEKRFEKKSQKSRSKERKQYFNQRPRKVVSSGEGDEHPCPNCEKSFKVLGSLRRHVKYFCGKKPPPITGYKEISKNNYQCEKCDRTYKTFNTVKEGTLSTKFLEFDNIFVPPSLEHYLINPASKYKKKGQNGDIYKKYSESFLRSGYSEDSQFACKHCGKRYRWKSTMRRHEQVECGGKEPMFKCPRCPYKAKQKGNLGVHIRKHHTQGNENNNNEFNNEDT